MGGSTYAAWMSDDGWLLAGPTTPDEVQRFYDDWAAGYDAELARWGYDAPVRAASLVSAAVDARSAATTVLDAGCGTGLAGAALRAAGYAGRLYGIDLSPASLEVAAGRGVYDALDVADLQRPLDIDADTFDAVMCVGVLTYVPDTLGFWRELARVVRPAGTVVCTQRADVWVERRCADDVVTLERDATWTVRLLTPSIAYLPGNADFGDAIGVRFLVANVR